jgi:uncharacterized membrane protein
VCVCVCVCWLFICIVHMRVTCYDSAGQRGGLLLPPSSSRPLSLSLSLSLFLSYHKLSDFLLVVCVGGCASYLVDKKKGGVFFWGRRATVLVCVCVCVSVY